jgi:hypothetical protein
MPWAYYHGLDASLEQKLDGIQRFAEDVLERLGRASPPPPVNRAG